MSSADVARLIADEVASCGIELVASLPDNWIADLIETAVQRGDKHYVRALREREHSDYANGFQFWPSGFTTYAM